MRLRWFVALLCCSISLWNRHCLSAAEPAVHWPLVRSMAAPEAGQAAAANEQFVYAVNNTHVAKYDRQTGRRIALSQGDAQHLNSAYLLNGRLYAAHSNYPQTPEHSEIKVLDLESMLLTTFHDFGASDGSLTWALFRDDHWWCNFAFYGDKNSRSYFAKFDAEWKEQARWTYPPELVAQLGRNSLSGGIWLGSEILATGHDDPVLFRLRVPKDGPMLELVRTESVPFTGQGIALDPATQGLVGIHRPRRQVLFAAPPTLK